MFFLLSKDVEQALLLKVLRYLNLHPLLASECHIHRRKFPSEIFVVVLHEAVLDTRSREQK